MLYTYTNRHVGALSQEIQYRTNSNGIYFEMACGLVHGTRSYLEYAK